MKRIKKVLVSAVQSAVIPGSIVTTGVLQQETFRYCVLVVVYLLGSQYIKAWKTKKPRV